MALQAGQYTVILPGNPESSDAPGGDSYGTVTVDWAGHIRLAATLADGTKITQSSNLSPNPQTAAALCCAYRGQGILIGWVNVGDSGDSDLLGNVTWINPGGAKAKAYPGGFRWDGQAIGSTYRRPANGAMLIDLSSGGAVTLAGGSLSQEVSNAVSLDSHNRIVTLGGARLSLQSFPD